MNQYGIATFHRRRDVLWATPIAAQLKAGDPGCHVTWFTSRAAACVLDHNPDVDEVVALDGTLADLDGQIPALRAGRAWTRFFTPAEHLNKEALPGGTALDQVRASSGLAWTVPFQPRLRLRPEEVRAARRYWTRLPAGPRVLIEADPRVEQSLCNEDFLCDLVGALRDIEPVLVVTAESKPWFFDQLLAIHPRSVWCREPFRLNAELFNLCDGFVGVGAGISALTSSDWCRTDVPRIEVVRGEYWGGTALATQSRLLPCYTRRRFRQALSTFRAWLAKQPAPALHGTRQALPATAPSDERPCPQCGQVRFHSARGGGIVTCDVCELIYTRVSGELIEHPVYRAPTGVSERRPRVALGLQGADLCAWRESLLQTALTAWGQDPARAAVLLLGEECAPLRDRLAQAGRPVVLVPLHLLPRLGDGLKPERLDVILAPHVLDRVADPLDLLDRLAFLLRPGGVLMVTVPNLASLGSAVFPRHWAWLDPEGRPTHFRPRQLRDLVRQSRLWIKDLRTTTGEAGLPAVFEALQATHPPPDPGQLPVLVERLHALGAGEELQLVAVR